MVISRSALKKSALALFVLFVLYVVAGWWLLPVVLQSQAEKFIKEKTAHQLTMDRPEFNPLTWHLHLSNIALKRPDNKPLISVGDLSVKLSAASLFHGAAMFNSIRIAKPNVTVALNPEGRLNWQDLIDALGKDSNPGKEADKKGTLPRLAIDEFDLTAGQVNFSDEKKSFSTQVEDLNLQLADISTLMDEQSHYTISARTSIGARLTWHGVMTEKPIAMQGHIALQDLDIAKVSAYLKGVVPASNLQGQIEADTDYSVTYDNGKTAFSISHAKALVQGLQMQLDQGPHIAMERIEAREGSYDSTQQTATLEEINLSKADLNLPRKDATPVDLFQLVGLQLAQLKIDLQKHGAELGKVTLQEGRIAAKRDAQGHIDLVDALQTTLQANQQSGKDKQAPKSEPSAPWHYLVSQIDLKDFMATLQDNSIAQQATLGVKSVNVSLKNLSDDPKTALLAHASFKALDGGTFDADGKVMLSEPSADFKFKLADLELKAVQPYLSEKTKLTLASGKVSLQGQAKYSSKSTNFKGGFSVNDVVLNETDSGSLIFGMKSLASTDVQASKDALQIGEVRLSGLDTELIIAKDKTINLKRILRNPTADATAQTSPAPAATPSTADKPAFAVDIDRLRVSESALNFADQSMAFPFGTRIHELKGSINGLSNRPSATGQLELDGQVDEYGLARAVGQIAIANPAEFTDINVVFRNVDMTHLTPYSATFAGRKIESGKLSLDLNYKVKKRQIEGNNQLVIDQLTLGEHVDSQQAVNLPLDLAIAILQDSDGRIELGLPVSGSMDDPQFSYGSIIWKAIVNVFTKIATAPFRALSGLLGGDQKFESIAFDAGDANLTPPEKEKVVTLAGALKKRPRLALTVHGAFAEADRRAMQDFQMRQIVARKAGQNLKADEDPGPLSTHNQKTQTALEDLYAEKFSSADLAAMKEGFRKANPGQMEQSSAGKMLSKLTDLTREKRTLNDEEVSHLQGADFHAVLFNRMRDKVSISDADLQNLAQARGAHIAEVLGANGIEAARTSQSAPEKVLTDGPTIAVKMVLGAN